MRTKERPKLKVTTLQREPLLLKEVCFCMLLLLLLFYFLSFAVDSLMCVV